MQLSQAVAPMLSEITSDLWDVRQPLRYLGMAVGTRTTVLRLRDGTLFVHSPGQLPADLRSALDQLGQRASAPTLSAWSRPGRFRAGPARSARRRRAAFTVLDRAAAGQVAAGVRGLEKSATG